MTTHARAIAQLITAHPGLAQGMLDTVATALDQASRRLRHLAGRIEADPLPQKEALEERINAVVGWILKATNKLQMMATMGNDNPLTWEKSE